MKIWGQDYNIRVKKIQVAANYAGVELALNEIDEAKRKEYLKRNPTGFVPTLEAPEGPLYQSNAILRYIARNSKNAKLYGSSPFEQALVDQWLDWNLSELEPALLAHSGAYLGFAPYVQEIQTASNKDFTKALQILNNHLGGRNYIAGDNISIADITLASTLNFAFQWLLDEKQRKNLSNVTKWYAAITSQDNWKSVYGRTLLCKKALNVYTGSLEDSAPEKTEEKTKAK